MDAATDQVSFKEFLEDASVGTKATVKDALFVKPPPLTSPISGRAVVGKTLLATPQLSFYCPTEGCQRELNFHARFETERLMEHPA